MVKNSPLPKWLATMPHFMNIAAAITLIIVAVFWENTLLTTLLVLPVSVFMLWHERKVPGSKVMFLFAGLFGGISEAIVIACGAWSYQNPTFIIPLWLLPVWGNAGLYMSCAGRYLKGVFSSNV